MNVKKGVFLILASALALPAIAAESEQELRRVIEDQQLQIDELKQQLDELRQLFLTQRGPVEPGAQDEGEDEALESVAKPAAEATAASPTTPSTRKAALSQIDRHDQKHPTGSNFAVGDHTKTMQLPSITTKIGVHGFTEIQAIHDTNGINDNEFDTILIPIDGSPSQTKFNANPSRLEVSSASDVPGGSLNTFFSMDLNGKLDSPDPRVRQAYGEIILENWNTGFLAGQAFATMLDLNAVPETLDFAGPAGAFVVRQPLFRATQTFADKLRLEAAVETPENVAYFNAKKLTRWPDFVTAVTWHTDGKYLQHFRLGGLLRDLGAEDKDGARDSAIGWAITASGKVELPFLGSLDNLRFNLNYGDGYGSQIKGGPDEAVFDPHSLQLSTIGIFGVDVGLQHWWSGTLRSNLVFGYVNTQNPGFVDEDRLGSTTYVAQNIIWNPFKALTFGAEWLWGKRENINGASGTGNRFLISSKFEF